jgi:hypothetical protein
MLADETVLTNVLVFRDLAGRGVFVMSDQMVWRNVTDPKRHAHSDLFALALCEDSNLAMDWLWLADLLDDELERQYCLHRAHYIDPTCVVVHAQPGFLVRFKTMVQSALNKRNASDERSEEQLATNF